MALRERGERSGAGVGRPHGWTPEITPAIRSGTKPAVGVADPDSRTAAAYWRSADPLSLSARVPSSTPCTVGDGVI